MRYTLNGEQIDMFEANVSGTILQSNCEMRRGWSGGRSKTTEAMLGKELRL